MAARGRFGTEAAIRHGRARNGEWRHARKIGIRLGYSENIMDIYGYLWIMYSSIHIECIILNIILTIKNDIWILLLDVIREFMGIWDAYERDRMACNGMQWIVMMDIIEYIYIYIIYMYILYITVANTTIFGAAQRIGHPLFSDKAMPLTRGWSTHSARSCCGEARRNHPRSNYKWVSIIEHPQMVANYSWATNGNQTL